MSALGYVFVDDDGGLGSSAATIRGWCKARGLALATVVHDAGGGHRRSLAWALEQIDAGGAELLVVARLRDLASDARDLVPLLRWFVAPERALVALDVALDTSCESGRVAAAAIADLVVRVGDPDVVSRVREGRVGGSTRGRAAVADVPELSARIATMRSHGMTLQAIADVLNEDGVPTVRGGRLWRPSSVQRATGYLRPSTGQGIELPKRAAR
jgi:DNA invertase Pin-like site-specific DNA recombinase